jgi:hypothetical protein
MDLERNQTEEFPTGQCDQCRHYLEGDRCLAFPRGIPLAILLGEIEHDRPFPGDGGVTFSPLD